MTNYPWDRGKIPAAVVAALEATMADITEAKIFEALGVQQTGAQAQEPADPATQNQQTDPAPGGNAADPEGAQGQEPATPAAEQVVTEPTAQTVPTAGQAAPAQPGILADTGAEGAEGDGLTLEQRRANAARRREQERQSAIDAAVQEERQKNDAAMAMFFKQAGLKNTFTGEPITTLAQFNDWNEKYQAQKLQQDLQAGKLTPEALEQVISNHPLMKQAGEVLRRNQEQEERNAQSAARAKVNEQLLEIGKMDPSIKSVQDLMAKPWYPELYGYVKRGFTLPEAYRQVNHETIVSAAADAARQQAMNNARGKDHLTAMGGGSGAGALSVPADIKAMFLSFNPNATDAQIQAYYNDYKKGK